MTPKYFIAYGYFGFQNDYFLVFVLTVILERIRAIIVTFGFSPQHFLDGDFGCCGMGGGACRPSVFCSLFIFHETVLLTFPRLTPNHIQNVMGKK